MHAQEKADEHIHTSTPWPLAAAIFSAEEKPGQNGRRLTLRAIGGIGAVEGSPVTGAMLIHYDGAAGNNPRFWDDVEAVLEYHHLHHDAPQPGHALRARPPGRQTVDPGPASSGWPKQFGRGHGRGSLVLSGAPVRSRLAQFVDQHRQDGA
ncbi:hypothetical protein LP419_35005 [Massilia sp. H-1]|nr:hypothetical protein LP419_35005 [Massilia sp. H-1]